MPLHIDYDLKAAKAHGVRMAQQIEARKEFIRTLPDTAGDAIAAHKEALAKAEKELEAHTQGVAKLQEQSDKLRAERAQPKAEPEPVANPS